MTKVPESGWLRLMLDEIERRRSEEAQALEERRLREEAQPADEGAPSAGQR